MYIYIYIYVCVCVCVCICMSVLNPINLGIVAFTLTGLATRRSEFPSRSTGLTADPSTFAYLYPEKRKKHTRIRR